MWGHGHVMSDVIKVTWRSLVSASTPRGSRNPNDQSAASINRLSTSRIGSLTGRADAALLPVSDLLSRLNALEETVNASTANQQLSLLQGDPPTHQLARLLINSLAHSLTLSLCLSDLRSADGDKQQTECQPAPPGGVAGEHSRSVT